MFLYEELLKKKENPIKLSLELAYSVPFDYQIDLLMGSVVITFAKAQSDLIKKEKRYGSN